MSACKLLTACREHLSEEGDSGLEGGNSYLGVIEGEIVVAQVVQGVGKVRMVARQLSFADFKGLFVVFQCSVQLALAVQDVSEVIQCIAHLQVLCRQRNLKSVQSFPQVHFGFLIVLQAEIDTS